MKYIANFWFDGHHVMTDSQVKSPYTLKFCCDILSSSSMIYRVCEDDDSKLRAQDIKAIIDL